MSIKYCIQDTSNAGLTFMGKKISYSTRWSDKDTFSLDAGDGNGLVDSDGDEYFIHVEYHDDEHRWIREVWFEDDYLVAEDWEDYNDKMRAEIDKIIRFAKTLL